MPPILAAAIFILIIAGLLYIERDPDVQVSRALWIPLAWVFINATRPVTMWLGMFGIYHSGGGGADQYMEGSPVDAAFFTLMLFAGLVVLSGRMPLVMPMLRRNGAVLVFFLYCLLSAIWSDFPFVTVKHWFKGIGDVVMVLVVLTDPQPLAALKRLITRISFVTIPLSILFMKYFGDWGRGYSISGEPMSTGVTTQKNTLGVICMTFGLFSLWRLIGLYRDRENARRGKQMFAHIAILMMCIWNLYMCNSVTSITTFAMVTMVLLVGSRKMFAGKTWVVHGLIGAMLFVSICALFVGPGSSLLTAVGRNPTLTGRTAIWSGLIRMDNHPILGTGYESFWVGPRLETFWSMDERAYDGIQEAHNGYLEVYLNLGWVGVSILGMIILFGYRNVIEAYKRNPYVGILCVCFYMSELTFDFTEAGFRMMFPLWFFFLLSIMIIPEPAVEAVEEPAPLLLNKIKKKQVARRPQLEPVTRY